MTSSGESAGQHVRAKTKAIRNAFRLHGRLCLAAFVLLAGVIPAVALADEAPSSSSPSELPVSALEEAMASPNTDETQLTDPQAAEELPHQDLGRDEAVGLTEAVFDPILQSVSGQFQDFEVEKFLSDNTAVVSVDAQPESLGTVGGGVESPTTSNGKETVLLESTVPLRTEDANGDMAPVDLELEGSGAQLQPREPLVDVRLPRELGDGIQLPEAGIGIELEGAPSGRAPSIVAESVAAYPNVGLDTDFSAVPTPTGLETLTTLRSANAPREQTLHLDLPPGAELRQDHLGAEVVQADQTILRVQPPFGVDANGESVPVTLTVSGDSLSIVASPDKDTTYPALIDPIIEAHDWFAAQDTYGQSAWYPKTVGSGMYAGGFNGGMQAFVQTGYHSSGDQAGMYYMVPRLKEEEALGRQPTSYIARMTLWHIGLENGGTTGSSQPYLFAGIWGGAEHWAGTAPHEAVWALAGNAQPTWMNPGYEVHMENGEPNKRDKGAKVAWGIGLATYENASLAHVRNGLLGAASVEVADDDNPSTANGSISPWVNQTASVPLTADATDTGLGVKRVEIDLPWRAPTMVANPCAGDALWPCPRTWTVSLPANQYYPVEMPQGFDYIPIGAEDVVGNKATLGATKALVKVDHTAPAVALSGSITEQAKLGTGAAQYKLNYAALDGDFQTAGPLASFGSAGTSEGKTQRPIGIATDAAGNVWVVDRGNNCVEKFDESGKFLMQFGSAGSGNGQFLNPNGIAISSAGNLWIADGGNHRIQQFNAKGEYLQQFGTGYTPGGPEGGTVLLEPYGVATAPGGMLWVSDYFGQRVAEYREGPTGERFVRNARGNASNSQGDPEFNRPTGIATDAQGDLWVVDTEHAKIKRFNSNGNFVMQFGAYGGTGNGQFYSAADIAVAPSGNLFVVDTGNNRIEEFQPTGSYLRQFGSAGSGTGQLSDPHGIALGANNTIFVADAGNHRVMRWSHADQDPQSGVGKVEIKVDSQLKATPYSQACSTNSCQTSGEWTYNASEYPTGQHKVEVVAEDGVKLTTAKSVTISSVKDTVPPQLTTSESLFGAPAGWVEQKSYSYSASAKDPGGYGVTSLMLKIDGKVVSTKSQSCPNGGCEAVLSGSINTANYQGGAHPAELIATDGAGLAAKKAWTLNVAPAGIIAPGEATDTIKALEVTDTEAGLVASNSEEILAAELEAGNDPEVVREGSDLTVTGVPVESEFSTTPADGTTIPTPDGSFHIEPINTNPASSDTAIVSEVAAVTSNTATQVDTVIRPLYTGLTDFQVIRGSSAPTSFSWNVSLHSGQTLESVDSKTAQVVFEDGQSMMMIKALPARDATGKAVATSLKVVGPDVIELTVAHKGGGFSYPVTAGPAFEAGYSSVEVTPPPSPPQASEAYWESSELQVGAPEPIPSNEASISTVGASRKEFVRVICGHSSFYRPDGPYTEACGNPFTGDTGFGVVWHAAMRGAFLYRPGAFAEQRGARACYGNGVENSPIYAYDVEPASQCAYGPRTSDGSGGQNVTGGHYLRAQAHWNVTHWALCREECNGTPNPIIGEDKALELHLWPSGAVELAGASG
jgi:sugar lactone lactonase YvrE